MPQILCNIKYIFRWQQLTLVETSHWQQSKYKVCMNMEKCNQSWKSTPKHFVKNYLHHQNIKFYWGYWHNTDIHHVRIICDCCRSSYLTFIWWYIHFKVFRNLVNYHYQSVATTNWIFRPCNEQNSGQAMQVRISTNTFGILNPIPMHVLIISLQKLLLKFK